MPLAAGSAGKECNHGIDSHHAKAPEVCLVANESVFELQRGNELTLLSGNKDHAEHHGKPTGDGQR